MKPARQIVIGARGNVGAELARILTNAGHEVVAPTRADITDTETRRSMLAQAASVFLLAGVRETDDLLAEAVASGVARVVLLSSAAVGDEANQDRLTSMHRRAERAVQQSSLAATILRPCAFASNALRWLPQLADDDAVPLPFPDLAQALIDPRDIADVAAGAMTDAGRTDAVYRLTGPEALLPTSQVEVLAEVTGRLLRPAPLDDVAARAYLSTTMPPAMVDAFFELYRGGVFDEGVVTDEVPRLLGRPAESFRAWATRHHARFDAAESAEADKEM